MSEVTLDTLSEKLDALLDISKKNAANVVALYRRQIALAHMVEQLAHGKEPMIPQVLRAEIDATLNVEAIAELLEKDAEEFIRHYGEGVYDVVKEKGVQVISRAGEPAPKKSDTHTH